MFYHGPFQDGVIVWGRVPGLALTAGALILPAGAPRPTFTAPDSRRRGGGERARGGGGGGERPAGREEEDGRFLVLLQGRRGGAGGPLHR